MSDTQDPAVEATRKLKAIITQTKMTQGRIAEALGTTQSNISRWIQDKPEWYPRRKNIDAINALYDEIFNGAELEDIEEFNSRSPRGRGDVENLTIISGAGGGGALSVEYGQDGELIDPAMSDGYWTFPASIKSGMRNLRQIKALPVIGDSMEPTIGKGSTVFVDTTHTYPSPEDIYAIDYGDGLVVKRLQLIPRSDRIRVISDNRETYGDPFDLSREEVRVYGRVVAWFQWRG